MHFGGVGDDDMLDGGHQVKPLVHPKTIIDEQLLHLRAHIADDDGVVRIDLFADDMDVLVDVHTLADLVFIRPLIHLIDQMCGGFLVGNQQHAPRRVDGSVQRAGKNRPDHGHCIFYQRHQQKRAGRQRLARDQRHNQIGKHIAKRQREEIGIDDL